MTVPYDGPDRFFWPVQIPSDANDFVISEDTTGDGNFDSNFTVTIEAGVWWLHADSTITADYRGLFRQLNDLLTVGAASNVSISSGSANNDYEFQPVQLSTHSMDYPTVGLVATTNNGKFQIEWGSSTLDPRLFGYGEDEGGSSDESTANSPNDTVKPPYSVYGIWQTKNKASDKRQDRVQKIFRSDDGRNARFNAWEPVRKRRKFMYHKVPGALVYSERARISDMADRAGLTTDDKNNGLEDLYIDSRLGDILVLHGKGDSSNNLTLNKSNRGGGETRNRDEVINFLSPPNFKDISTNGMRYGDEYYDVDMDVNVTEATNVNGYDH